MGVPTTRHGDQKLNNPDLDEDACSNCHKPVEWNIVPHSDGSSIKTCPTCGLKVNSKPPVSATSKKDPDAKGGKNFLERLFKR